MFDFVMKMFSDGDVAVPELGMEEIQNNCHASEGGIQCHTR
jgi:hypothetical protein